MHFDVNLGNSRGGFRHIAFDRRFRRLLKSIAGKYKSRDATREELVAWEKALSHKIEGLAKLDDLLLLHDHNPSIFQIVEDATLGRTVGFNAQLPLSKEGSDALKAGQFSTKSPLIKHVARKGQHVDAIYVWLTYSPRSFVATVSGLSDFLEEWAPAGCDLFCTPINERTSALFKKCGYKSARDSFPSMSKDMLVAHRISLKSDTKAKVSAPPPTRIEITPARTMHDMAQVTAIRAATYMHEQECPFDEEFDGNDFCSTHLIGRINGEPAGCIRIRYFSDFVKFERLAVRHEFRTSKLAYRLVREAMSFVARKGYRRVYGHSRHDLVRFWQTFGFRPLPGRPLFSFSDVEYVEMEGPINLKVAALSVGSDPLHMIRPEGLWDKPGILERNQSADRQRRIEERLSQRRPNPKELRSGRHG